jgi:hypothetical protein
VAGATDRGAGVSRFVDRGRLGDPMVIATRFGRKLKVPSTVQIKRQLLLLWLADQEQKEAAEEEKQKVGSGWIHVRNSVSDSI